MAHRDLGAFYRLVGEQVPRSSATHACPCSSCSWSSAANRTSARTSSRQRLGSTLTPPSAKAFGWSVSKLKQQVVKLIPHCG